MGGVRLGPRRGDCPRSRKNDAGALGALGKNADLCYHLSAGQGLFVQFQERALGRRGSREAPRSKAPSLTRAATEAILDAGPLQALPAWSGRACCSAWVSLARRPRLSVWERLGGRARALAPRPSQHCPPRVGSERCGVTGRVGLQPGKWR